jgi:hypothetical protein
MQQKRFDPREPDPGGVPDYPRPTDRDLDDGSDEIPEPPNRDEVRPDDDVNPAAGTVEPPD